MFRASLLILINYTVFALYEYRGLVCNTKYQDYVVN